MNNKAVFVHIKITVYKEFCCCNGFRKEDSLCSLCDMWHADKLNLLFVGFFYYYFYTFHLCQYNVRRGFDG